MLGLPLEAMPVVMLAVLIGSVALMLLGAMAAAVVIGARRASILTAVVILPLAMPVLIFGTAASLAAVEGTPVFSHLALLGATTLVLLAITPLPPPQDCGSPQNKSVAATATATACR